MAKKKSKTVTNPVVESASAVTEQEDMTVSNVTVFYPQPVPRSLNVLIYSIAVNLTLSGYIALIGFPAVALWASLPAGLVALIGFSIVARALYQGEDTEPTATSA